MSTRVSSGTGPAGGPARRRARVGPPHRALAFPGHLGLASDRSHSSRSCRCCGRGSGARPGRAALYGFVAGVAFFGVLLSWIGVLRRRRDRPARRGAGGVLGAAAGAVVGTLARAGSASPFLTAAAWVVLEALRGPLAARRASRGADRRRAARLPRGAGAGELRRVPLVTFVVVRGQRAPPRVARVAVAGTGRGQPYRPRSASWGSCWCRGRRHHPLRAVDHRAPAVRAAPGERQGHGPWPSEINQRLHGQAPRARRPAARSLRPDRVPRVVARDRPRDRPGAAAGSSPRSAAKHGASVLANVIDDSPGPGTAVPQREPALRPRRPARRARTRSSTSCRSASTSRGATRCRFISELQQIPHDFHPGDSPTMFTVAGHADRHASSASSRAFGPLDARRTCATAPRRSW